jgi:hypothetical protein
MYTTTYLNKLLHYLDSCDFKSKPDCSVALNLFILRLD